MLVMMMRMKKILSRKIILLQILTRTILSTSSVTLKFNILVVKKQKLFKKLLDTVIAILLGLNSPVREKLY